MPNEAQPLALQLQRGYGILVPGKPHRQRGTHTTSKEKTTKQGSEARAPLPQGLLLLKSSKLFQDSRPFLLPLLLRGPKLVTVLHRVRQHRSSDEHQVFPARGVLDVELELLQTVCVAFENVFQIPATDERV